MTTKRIAVIGGGAAGLAVLKVFLEQPQLKSKAWSITAFEARDDIGGVWLPAPPTSDPPLTPLYDSLTTNLPHPIMSYQTHSFPPSTPLFPRASYVLSYLHSYASTFGLMPYIRLDTAVDNVMWNGKQWEVSVTPGGVQLFDFIVVANGHYSLPRLPPFPGIQQWQKAGKVMHSAWYRNPTPFKGKTCLVIGGGPSGQDISAEVAGVAKKVYHSVKGFANEDSGNVSKRGAPIRFEADGTVVFADGSKGTGIDCVIPATGYQYDYPFFPPALLQTSPKIPHRLYNSTNHIFPLAKHLFPIQDDFPPSTVAFIGLPSRVIPFPIFEAQARVVAKVFANPACLDIQQEMKDIIARDDRLRKRTGGDDRQVAKDWHRMPDEEQFEYRTALLEFADAKEWAVEDWAYEMYDAKGDLRREWREIESRGEGEKWVRGVGEGGKQEWVDLMRRLLKRAAATKCDEAGDFRV